MRHFFKRSGIIFVAIVCGILFLELSLRVTGWTLREAQRRHNARSLTRSVDVRILCLGESTTARVGAGQMWPELLENRLNLQSKGLTYGVINAGIVGARTDQLVQSVPALLQQYKPDMIISMMGINDREGVMPYDNNIPSREWWWRTLRVVKLIDLIGRHSRQIFFLKPDRAIAERADPVSMLLKQGRFYKETLDHENAHDSFLKVLELDPQNEDAYIELGYCALFSGHGGAEALAYWEKGLAFSKYPYKLYVLIGNMYRELDRSEDAFRMFSSAIALDENNPRAYVSMGWLLRDRGDYDEAQRMFFKAFSLARADIGIAHSLALVLQEKGDREGATEYNRQVLSLSEEQPFYEITRYNYKALISLLKEEKIPLIAVQYPMREVAVLEKMVDDSSVFFVDLRATFIDALSKGPYRDYFGDSFAGDFGHCTEKGNALIAQTVAQRVLEIRAK